MKKIVGMIKPFDMKQNLYVYEDGNKLAAATPKMDELADTIFAFMKEYGVTQLDLVGAKQFNRGLSKQILAAEMSKYNENKLEINVI